MSLVAGILGVLMGGHEAPFLARRWRSQITCSSGSGGTQRNKMLRAHRTWHIGTATLKLTEHGTSAHELTEHGTLAQQHSSSALRAQIITAKC